MKKRIDKVNVHVKREHCDRQTDRPFWLSFQRISKVMMIEGLDMIDLRNQERGMKIGFNVSRFWSSYPWSVWEREREREHCDAVLRKACELKAGSLNPTAQTKTRIDSAARFIYLKARGWLVWIIYKTNAVVRLLRSLLLSCVVSGPRVATSRVAVVVIVHRHRVALRRAYSLCCALTSQSSSNIE